jgi:dephospho-CoA kinase
VLGPDGALDRPRLAARVFADPAERAALNAIVHPRIQAAVLAQTHALAEAGAARVIYDAALLIENGLHRGMHGVVLVVASPEVQLARLMRRDGLSREAAEARVASQLPLDQKRPHATWIIDNDGTLDDTRAQVDEVFRAMVATPAPA